MLMNKIARLLLIVLGLIIIVAGPISEIMNDDGAMDIGSIPIGSVLTYNEPIERFFRSCD